MEQEEIKKMMGAIKGGDTTSISIILEGNPKKLNYLTPLGSWLHIAASYGQKSVVELLLSLGIDVNIDNGKSGNALDSAVGEGHLEIVKFLHSSGAKLDVSDPEKNPLFAAIYEGYSEIAQYLIDAGIDTTVKYTGKSMKNMDALAFALEWGRKDIVEMLEKGSKNSLS